LGSYSYQMRVYHFVSAKHGLDNLKRRRLKVATIDGLNDPFELLSATDEDSGIRARLRRWKQAQISRTGFLCFCRRYGSPVLWSHYAEKHNGICLGFDVIKSELHEVNYSPTRIALKLEDEVATGLDDATAMAVTLTKFSDWSYEHEWRLIVPLAETVQEGSLHFQEFGPNLRLKRVIVGASSDISRAQIHAALGGLCLPVDVFKAGLSAKTFRMVKRSDRFWS
jgi:hypothetical protein